MTRDLCPRVARRALAVAALLAVFASASPLTPEAHAQQQKKNGKAPTTGSIEISTTPGGYPIYIDGVYSGETTEYMRAFEQRPGPHKVVIVFPNGTEWKHDINTVAGRKDCITLAYRPRQPPSVVEKKFCPYSVNVTATALARDGDQITFTADAGSYGGPQSDLNYTWTVEPSTFLITRGDRNSPIITVDSTGIGEGRIKATVVVEDSSGDPACRQQNHAETRFIPPPPSPPPYLDDFVSVAPDFDKAHLDALVVELQRNPTYRGFLIAYGGCGPRDRSPEELLKRAHSYVTGERNIDSSRITGILGGYRERNAYELHVRSPGLKDPTPTPTRGPCTAGGRTRR
jgi:hypothetical protein